MEGDGHGVGSYISPVVDSESYISSMDFPLPPPPSAVPKFYINEAAEVIEEESVHSYESVEDDKSAVAADPDQQTAGKGRKSR